MDVQEFTGHIPVLLSETLEYFSANQKKIEPLHYLDLTLGGGGHFTEIINKFDVAHAVGLDQDADAIAKNQNLKTLGSQKIEIVHTNFFDFLEGNVEKYKNYFHLILGDLGVSSHHFDCAKRGFSFRFDGPLDMRMDQQNNTLTAAEILNEYDEKEIADIIFEFGEDRLSRKIAAKIIEFRREKKIETTKELENIVFHSYPKHLRHKKTHPATRTFQALRIFVNREFEVLRKAIEILPQFLAPSGRLGLISFHSSEDRIIKHGFKALYSSNKNLKIITKRPIVATEKEVQVNRRSRSAKLRVLEKQVL